MFTELSLELEILALTVVLGLLHLFLVAGASASRRGIRWNLSSRDSKMPELSGVLGRIQRSFENFKETFAFFAVAILIVQLLKKNNDISSLGAQIYFGARLIYIFIYAAGVPVLRTIVWFISIIGILMVLKVALLN